MCTTPFCRGVEPPTRFLKKGGVLEENSAFRGGLLGKRGKNFLTGGCYVYIKWYFCGRGGVDTPMHTMSDAKSEEKLIFCFKNGKNLVNFDLSTKKYKKIAL